MKTPKSYTLIVDPKEDMDKLNAFLRQAGAFVTYSADQDGDHILMTLPDGSILAMSQV